MKQGCSIKAPFFEIGPKSYLFGQDVIDLAVAADEASKKYDVDIIFTTPIVEIARVKAATSRIHVFAPHMDPLRPGRGLADILPESLVAAGAEGVMLNHCEKPLTLAVLRETIKRADEVGLATIVCADSLAEASMIAMLKETSMAATITVMELFRQAQVINGRVYEPLALYIEAAVIYLLFCTILTWLQHRGEKRLNSYGGARA
jgi:triosephosphate isomerase